MNRESDLRSTLEEEPNFAMRNQKHKTKQHKKSLALDDAYEHAPPKDVDPWAVLFKPEMEADKIRCNAWKEEVQTLLIFAGLFSAVVTPFVIESYKFLQPNPNDVIISLLSQIANGSNNTLLSTGSPPSTVTSFAQTPSSVRINVFWFISLILSLTTVLVGTIGLQWLREHQSYQGFSSKESFAILHMRSEMLKACYVPQVFATLPLLLQGAVVLFLVGLIDFTLPLGTKLAIPVACIIGIILLFLVATTVLPTFQPLFFLFGPFCFGTIPAPCAFKSPQSQAFRALLRILLHFVFPKLPPYEEPPYKRCRDAISNDLMNPFREATRRLFPHVHAIWHRKTWATVDLGWLSLRDSWHNRALDNCCGLFDHQCQLQQSGAFPLSDITQSLVRTITEPPGAKHTDEFLAAACYCFEDLSASVWIDSELWTKVDRVDRHNHYFERLLSQQYNRRFFSMASFLIYGGSYGYMPASFYPTIAAYVEPKRALFHRDQVCVFLERLLDNHESLTLDHYRVDMKLRILQFLMENGTKPLFTLESDIDFFRFTEQNGWS